MDNEKINTVKVYKEYNKFIPEVRVKEINDTFMGIHYIQVDLTTNPPEYYLNGGEEGIYSITTVYPEDPKDIFNIIEVSFNEILHKYLGDKNG